MTRVDIRIVGLLLVTVAGLAYIVGALIGRENTSESGGWVASELTKNYVSSVVIDPRDPDIMYALADNGIAHSIDRGAHWTFPPSPLPSYNHCSSVVIAPSTPSTIYALCAQGDSGAVHYITRRTTDGGGQWVVLRGSVVVSLTRILAVDPQNSAILYGEASGRVFKSTNGGETWEQRTTGLEGESISAFVVDPTNSSILYTSVALPAYEVMDGLTGAIFKSENGGVSWQELGPRRFLQRPLFSLAVHPHVPSMLLASGIEGVWKSLDSGKNWVASGLWDVVHSFTFDRQNPKVIYASSPQGVVRSDDGGDSWVTLNKRLSETVLGLAIDKTRLYAGTAGAGMYSLRIDNLQLPEIAVTVESPEDGQPVSGLTLVRVKALHLDDKVQIPLFGGISFFAGLHPSCCVKHLDAQSRESQIQPKDSPATEWGLMYNWGDENVETFGVRIFVQTQQGVKFFPRPSTVTVVKPGGFSFIDQFDLNAAKAAVVGDELAITGLVVRDKATQQQKHITACFRWFVSSQSFGLIPPATCEARVALTVPLFTRVWRFLGRVFHSLFGFIMTMADISPANAAETIRTYIERPDDQQIVSGVGVIHGWAFPTDESATIREIRLLIDGSLRDMISCCSKRPDVFAHFRGGDGGHINEVNSGWGTFVNYGELTAGSHRIGVRIEDSAGNSTVIERNITVVRLGGFEFVDRLDLSRANARIEGEEIVLSRVAVRDRDSQRIKIIDLHLRWLENVQALGIVSSSS